MKRDKKWDLNVFDLKRTNRIQVEEWNTEKKRKSI